MPIKVYHKKKPNFLKCDADPKMNTDYELVAEVDTNRLDDAFRLTNHIDSDWTLNEGVHPLKSEVRSTSVGDILEVIDANGNVVERVGIQCIGFKEYDI